MGRVSLFHASILCAPHPPHNVKIPEMWCGTEAGSYWRLINSCTTQLKAQGPSGTCNESKEEEEKHLLVEVDDGDREPCLERDHGHGGPADIPCGGGLVYEAHRLV